MNGNFKVGEVLIGQNCNLLPQYNGAECVVIGANELRKCQNKITGKIFCKFSYLVQWQDGKITATGHRQLRRKQPPTGEASILNMFVVAPPKRMKEEA